MNPFEILWNYRQGFASGLLVTAKLCGIVWFVGLTAGTLIGIAGVRHRMSVGIPMRALGFILAGMPSLILLIWVHYPLQSMLHVVIDPFVTTSAVLSLLNILVVSDIVCRALTDFSSDYTEAALVCGLSASQTVAHIQLPIVARQIAPSILRTQVTMLHATIFGGIISVNEIFRVSQQVNSIIYRPVEIYSVLAMLFLCISLPLNGIILLLRKQLTLRLRAQ